MTNPLAILDYVWIIPTLITIGMGAWAFLTPAEDMKNDAIWLPDPMPLVRAAVAIIVSLAVWLIYFIVF